MRMSFGNTRIETRRVAELDAATWDEIWTLAARFTDTSREIYEQSVREKRDCVLLRDRSGALVGLGTVDLFELSHEGRVVTVLFPGNTVFGEGVRGQSLVERIGFLYFLGERLKHPTRPIYLCYDTFSYRSYRMLCRNFAEFWPRRGAALPRWEAGLFDAIGRRRYGAAWDPATGVIRGDGSRRLKEWVAPVTPELLEDPDIRHFAALNPGYASGDVLFVMCPLSARNWLHAFGSVARQVTGKRRSRVASRA